MQISWEKAIKMVIIVQAWDKYFMLRLNDNSNSSSISVDWLYWKILRQIIMNNDVLDIDLLTDYFDNLGKDIVEQMLALYERQSEIYLKDIAKSISDDGQQPWQENCHKMKGAAGSVGLKQVHALLSKFEMSEQSSTTKLSMVDDLMQINQVSIRSFKQWLSEL